MEKCEDVRCHGSIQLQFKKVLHQSKLMQMLCIRLKPQMENYVSVSGREWSVDHWDWRLDQAIGCTRSLRTLNKEVVQDWHLEVGTRVKSERGDQTSLSSKNFAVERSKDLHKSSKEIPWMHHYFHDRVPIDANSKLRVGSTFRFSVSTRCSWQTQMEIT